MYFMPKTITIHDCSHLADHILPFSQFTTFAHIWAHWNLAEAERYFEMHGYAPLTALCSTATHCDRRPKCYTGQIGSS
jgi:hypothetical protein